MSNVSHFVKLKQRALLVLLFSFFAGATAQAQFAALPGSERFEREATIMHSISRYDGDEEIQLIRKPKQELFDLRFVRDDKIIFSLPASNRMVFKEVKGVIYYVRYHTSASGCTVVAYDLTSQKELWRSELQALGPVSHSAYSNLVTINADEADVWIYGQESYGNYFEKLDTKSGKTILNRKLE